jgi:ABC-type lipoprotein export system ATPase subunit
VSVLDLIDVSQVFGDKANPTYALRNVSMSVEQRQVIIIMGPSGSGKSTMLAIAGALRRPTSGRVIVDGKELTGMNDSQLADVRLRTIGFVFQEFNLLDALTVRQNLEFIVTRAGVPRAQARARCEELLRILGLSHRMDYRIGALSGGERQRVAIARALANNASVILADEPTASLDGVRGAEVMTMLRMAAHDMGKAVVMVSHDHRVIDYADRVVWLQDGLLEDREPESMASHAMPSHAGPPQAVPPQAVPQ